MAGTANPANKDKTERTLTFGEKAVGLTFNPTNNPKVQDLKEKAAAFIDACDAMRQPTRDEQGEVVGKVDSEIARMASIAITDAQTAQMWAVKAATWHLKQD